MAKDVDRIRRALLEQGWRIESRKGGHDMAFPPDKAARPVPLPGTPSGARWLPNLVGQLRRSGFIVAVAAMREGTMEEREWAVTVALLLEEEVSEELLSDLVDGLTEHGAAVSGLDREVSVTLTVVGCDGAVDAAIEGRRLVMRALKSLRAVVVGDVALEAVTAEEADRRLEEPQVPELFGAADAAAELGVSRQRIHQLAGEHPLFPPPVARVAMGPLWTADSIRGFARRWERRPGRPRHRADVVEAR